jgi:hypothetical protein
MDFSSVVKNTFLRFVYSIIIPGVLVSSCITLNFGKVFRALEMFVKLNISFEFIVSFVFLIFTFISGLLIEVLGVYIESKFIDKYVYLARRITKKEFDRLWNQYLMISRHKTEDLIMVDYYRSILIKMKFLINLPVSLLSSYVVIIFGNFYMDVNYFDLNSIQSLRNFLIFSLIIFLISLVSFIRASFCALTLFDARKELLKYVGAC